MQFEQVKGAIGIKAKVSKVEKKVFYRCSKCRSKINEGDKIRKWNYYDKIQKRQTTVVEHINCPNG